MDYWLSLLYTTILIAIFNSIGILLCYTKKYNTISKYLFLSSIIVQLILIISIWIDKNTAPLQTIGETRIWYSFFISIVGLFIYLKYRINWMNIFTTFMCIMFNVIVLVKDNTITTPTPPILHSIWFIPHVSLYMVSYAILGCVAILSIFNLINKNKIREDISNQLLLIGTICFSIGMILGSVWAYSAWSSFWSWDVKESIALITWLIYIICVHLSINHKKSTWVSALSIIGFALLQICWWGIKYLPIYSQSNHIY